MTRNDNYGEVSVTSVTCFGLFVITENQNEQIEVLELSFCSDSDKGAIAHDSQAG